KTILTQVPGSERSWCVATERNDALSRSARLYYFPNRSCVAKLNLPKSRRESYVTPLMRARKPATPPTGGITHGRGIQGSAGASSFWGSEPGVDTTEWSGNPAAKRASCRAQRTCPHDARSRQY